MQEGIYYHSLDPSSPSLYFEQYAYRIQGEIDVALANESICKVIERHDILRTVFIQKGAKRTYQVVLKKRELICQYEDLTEIEDKKRYIRNFQQQDRNNPFDISKDMLMRVAIFKLAPSEFYFIWSFHHILMDGWSTEILISEFSRFYESLKAKKNLNLSDPIPYRAYIDWIERRDKSKAINYWKQYLNDYEQKDSLLASRKSAANQKPYKKTSFFKQFDSGLTSQISTFSLRNKITINSFVQAVWGILLSKYSNQEDIVFGHVVSDRPTEIHGADTMIGLFINTLPVRIEIKKGDSFLDLLKRTQEHAIQHNDFKYYPLFEIYSNTDLKPGSIDHVLVFENYPRTKKIESPSKQNGSRQQSGYKISDVSIFEQTSFDFNLLASMGENLFLQADYNENVYNSEDVELVFAQLERIIVQVLIDENYPIAKLRLLTSQEEDFLFNVFDNSNVEFPRVHSVISLFDQQVASHADHVAIVCQDHSLTYNELDVWSNQIAFQLMQENIESEDIVGLVFDPGFEMIASILGVLKAGGGYLPIDPQLPVARFEFMLRDSSAKCLLTNLKINPEIRFDGKIIPVAGITSRPGKTYGRPTVTPNQLAYVIYTSGTTGIPKGVMIEHINIVRLLFNDKNLFSFSDQDNWTLFHAYTFDVSVWEMYGALLNGGKLVVFPRSIAREPDLYHKILLKERIGILCQTPTAFYNLQVEDQLDYNRHLHVKQVIFAGEELSVKKLLPWATKYPSCQLINMYGTTETTVHASYKLLQMSDILDGTRSIGRALPTLSIHIMDEQSQLYPTGVTGELFIGGVGLGRGYLNRPELTSIKFPKSKKDPQKRFYRTGDNGRTLTTNEIEYLGRFDNQVQLRGYRIELGEVENWLNKYGDVKESVVLLHTDERGDQYLSAYLVCNDDQLDVESLRTYLGAFLPDYMIPVHYVRIKNIPMTVNGKVDRAALFTPRATGLESLVPPNDPTEKQLIELWKEVLNIDSVGIKDSFFNVGGDSIRSLRVLSGIRSKFGIRLRVTDLYSHTTIEQLALKIKLGNPETAARNYDDIDKRIDMLRQQVLASYKGNIGEEVEDVYPMSDIQMGMIFHAMKDQDQSFYHDQFFYPVSYHNFDAERFEKALRLLVRQHGILRTSFDMENFESPVQILHRKATLDVQFIDISQKDRRDQEDFVHSIVSQDREKRFDVSKPGLLRLKLFVQAKDHFFILVSFHHAILDGWSVASILTQLNNTYFRLEKWPDMLPDHISATMKDFIRIHMAEKDNAVSKEYWKNEMRDFKHLELANASSRKKEGALKSYVENLGSSLLAEVKVASKKTDSSVKHLCFAAYILTMNSFSYENDVTVGIVSDNRPDVNDGDKLIGCFLNSVPFRLQLPQKISWKEFRSLIDNKLKALKNYDRLSLIDIMKICEMPSDNHNPFFDTLFNFIDFYIFKELVTSARDKINSQIQPKRLAIENYENTNTLLDFIVDVTQGDIRVKINYAHHFISDVAATELVEHFKVILEKLIANENEQINNNDLLADKVEKLSLNNRMSYPAEETLISEWETQVSHTSGHIAVKYNDQSITYSCLNKKANQFARYLQQEGVSARDIVPVLCEPSIEMVIAIFGVLKAGACYLPVDPAVPDQRLQFMLNDCGARYAVVQETMQKRISFLPKAIILSEKKTEVFPEEDLPIKPASSDLAYIIFTSGTTGFPKGVMIEHRNVVRLFHNDSPLFNFSSNDVWTLFHSYAFDFSVWELFGALLFGGTTVIIPAHVRKDPYAYMDILEKEQVTILNQTPSAFYNLQEILAQKKYRLAVRKVIFGGDALKPSRLVLWRECFPACELINMYGITETTVHVTFKKLGNDDIIENSMGIGFPIPTLETFILNNQNQLLPNGTSGELCIGGDGLARGYMNRPELTKQRFIDHPFRKGEQLYRSGDMAFMHENELFYQGRLDEQVQLRGYRIELGEIDNCLAKYNTVSSCVTLFCTDSSLDPYLCSYLVTREVVSTDNLLNHLKRYLPDYMLPSSFIFLDEMPLTSNGKIDKKKLPLLTERRNSHNEHEIPETAFESRLLNVWKEVLGTQRIGMHDSFFRVGGDSIKAIRVVSRINTLFKGRISIADLYNNDTIRLLGLLLKENKRSGDQVIRQEIEQTVNQLSDKVLNSGLLKDSNDVELVFPMSEIEKGMVFHSIKAGKKGIYHDQMVHQVLMPSFNLSLFRMALDMMIEKHAILRSTFDLNSFEEPVHIVYKKINERIEYIDLTEEIPEDRQGIIRAYLTKDLEDPIDIHNGPLWRLTTFKLSNDNVVIIFVCHHAIMDGWSDASFNTELYNIYTTLIKDITFRPIPLKCNYRTAVIEELVEKGRPESRDFWKEELADFCKLTFQDLKKGILNGKTQTCVARRDELYEEVNAFSQKQGISVKNICFSAYVLTLNMISFEGDILLGLISNTRPVVEDGDKLLGCFLNTIPVRIKIPERVSFLNFCREVDLKLKMLKEFEGLPLAEIVKLHNKGGVDGSLFFDTIFNFIDFHIYDNLAPLRANTETDTIQKDQTKLSLDSRAVTNTELDFNVDVSHGAFQISICDNHGKFLSERLELFLRYYTDSLRKILNSPDEIIIKQELLTESEQNHLIKELNPSKDIVDEVLLHKLAESSAYAFQHKIALIKGVEQVTYGELDRKSNQLAHRLKSHGVGADSLVLLCMERSVEMIIGMLGILKAGGAYVPVDILYPPERLRYMIEDVNSNFIVCSSQTRSKFPPNDTQHLICLDDDQKWMDEYPGGPPDTTSDWNSLAYLIYTSGSTGRPKGVMIEHRSIVNYILHEGRYLGMTSDENILFLANYCFDASVQQIFFALVFGGTLIMMSDEDRLDIAKFERTARQNKVTHFDTSPGFLANISGGWPGLRRALIGGEACNFQLAEKWSKEAKFYNEYGPTEAAVAVTVFDNSEKVSERGDVLSIGKIVGSVQIYLLDRSANLVPLGEIGELCIAGVQVGRGYLNNPELSHRQFIHNCIEPEKKGSRIYKTGDLARWLPGGYLDFCGRKDDQVKVRGFRVEIGEVEAVLANCKLVKRAVVLAQTESSGNKRLIGFVEPEGEFNKEKILVYLRDRLPEYMIPYRLVCVTEFKLNRNGKIDKQALMAYETNDLPDKEELPTNETEKILASIWHDLLRIDRIGVNANFFELGGHSLLAMRMVSSIRAALDVDVSISAIFKFSTISTLGKWIELNMPEHKAESQNMEEIDL